MNVSLKNIIFVLLIGLSKSEFANIGELVAGGGLGLGVMAVVRSSLIKKDSALKDFDNSMRDLTSFFNQEGGRQNEGLLLVNRVRNQFQIPPLVINLTPCLESLTAVRKRYKTLIVLSNSVFILAALAFVIKNNVSDFVLKILFASSIKWFIEHQVYYELITTAKDNLFINAGSAYEKTLQAVDQNSHQRRDLLVGEMIYREGLECSISLENILSDTKHLVFHNQCCKAVLLEGFKEQMRVAGNPDTIRCSQCNQMADCKTYKRIMLEQAAARVAAAVPAQPIAAPAQPQQRIGLLQRMGRWLGRD